MQTTNVYEIIIKSNDTLFVIFYNNNPCYVYLYRQSNYGAKVWSFIALQEWSKIKTEKKCVRSFIVFYLKEFLDRTGCSYK